MKLIIAGSRSIEDLATVQTAFEESPYTIAEVETIVCGMADGVDTLGKQLFEDKSTVEIKEFPVSDYIDDAPNPSVAPLYRNTAMAENATALLAVWDGSSRGTKDMISKAKQEDLQLYIHRTDTTNLTQF